MERKIEKIEVSDFWAKSAIVLSVALSFIMILLKLYGWYATSSLSILSSLTDSLMDILVSALNLFAVYYALKPADSDHRFGHRSIEDIAGLFQAAVLAGTTFLIVIQSISRFINPVEADESIGIGYTIMIISLFLTCIIVGYQRFAMRKSKSLVIEADNYHYLSDLLTTIAVLASLYMWKNFGLAWVDPVLAIIIVSVIAHGAYKIGIRSFNNLMDKEMEDSEKEKIRAILKQAKENKEIKGYHDLRTRRSGQKVFIQLHMDLDKTLSFMDAHDIADRIENDIKALFQDADVIIHEDPS